MAGAKSGSSIREIVRPQSRETDIHAIDRIPPQKALDLFRPGWDFEQNPIPPDKQKTYTSRINITFRQVLLFQRQGQLC